MAHSERRRSLPNTPLTARRRNSHAVREQLLVWGHVYYGNAMSADCFVVAVALRRNSEAAPPPPPSGKENSAESDSIPTTLEKQPAKAPTDSRVTIRARVRPRDIERKPFILQRSFDLDEMRGTIPEPPPSTPASAHPGHRRDSTSVELLSPSVAAVTPRSADFNTSGDRRRSSESSERQTKEGIKEGAGSAESINRSLIRGANALPMRESYT